MMAGVRGVHWDKRVTKKGSTRLAKHSDGEQREENGEERSGRGNRGGCALCLLTSLPS